MNSFSNTFMSSYLHALQEHICVFGLLDSLNGDFKAAANLIVNTLQSKHKLIVAGNGGSASDSAHFVAELTGRYELERDPVQAIDLVSNSSAITAISNDYSYSEVFTRQLQALSNPGDLLICISTSGKSSNLVNAAVKAKKLGLNVLSLLGKDGGLLLTLSDSYILVPSNRVSRIQEAHIFILHEISSIIDYVFTKEQND